MHWHGWRCCRVMSSHRSLKGAEKEGGGGMAGWLAGLVGWMNGLEDGLAGLGWVGGLAGGMDGWKQG